MSESTAQLGSFVFSQSWRFFDIQVPGFSFTFGQMMFGIAICIISLMVLKVFFGIGGRGGGTIDHTTTTTTNAEKNLKNHKRDDVWYCYLHYLAYGS